MVHFAGCLHPRLDNIGKSAESSDSSSDALARSLGRGSKARHGAGGGVTTVLASSLGAASGRRSLDRRVRVVGTGGLGGGLRATQILNVGNASLLRISLANVLLIAPVKELKADAGGHAVGVVLEGGGRVVRCAFALVLESTLRSC